MDYHSNNLYHCSYCECNTHCIKNCSVDTTELSKLFDSSVEPDFANMSMRLLKKLASIIGVPTSYPKIRLILICKRYWIGRNKHRNQHDNNTDSSSDLRNPSSTGSGADAGANTGANANAGANAGADADADANTKSQLLENDTCPICMENIDLAGNGTALAVCRTSCGHTFCTSCFTKCVLRKNSCPMCRAEIIDNNEYTHIQYNNEHIQYNNEPIQYNNEHIQNSSDTIQYNNEHIQNSSDTIDSYITSYGYITSYDSINSDTNETRQVFVPSLEEADNNLLNQDLLNQELNDVYPSETDSMLSSSLSDDITNIVDIFESWQSD